MDLNMVRASTKATPGPTAPVAPEDYLRCMYCEKTYVLEARLRWHVKNHHNDEAGWDIALMAYLDTRTDAKAAEEADKTPTYKHPETKVYQDGSAEALAAMGEVHLGAVAAMMQKVDTHKLLTFELAKNGSDLLRVLANKVSNRVQGSLSLDDRLDIAKQMYTMAGLLEQLYKELKDTDLRVLQTKARRWDTVAKAVVDSLSEETRDV